MSRTLRVAALLLGVAILALLVAEVGLDSLVDGVRTIGWLTLPIVALHGIVYGLNTVAWWLTLRHETDAPPFRTLFRVSLAGFAINFLTPIVNAGGEPYRIAALTPWLGTRRAAGSVLQYAVLHALSSLLMWLTAIAAALTLVNIPGPTRVGLIIAAGVILAALLVVRSAHRRGFVAGIAAWIAQRGLGRISAWMTRREAAFTAIDQQLATLHAERPGTLVLAIAVDYLSRCVAVGELVLIAYGIGVSVSLVAAVMISGLSALAVNVLFLLPWEMGSREGSLFLLFGLAGVPAAVGVIAAVITRLREFVWCAIGLALAGGRAAVTTPTPEP